MKTLILITGLIVLSGCVSTGGRANDAERQFVAAVCKVWTPASYDSTLDSLETREGNRRLNARRAAFCK